MKILAVVLLLCAGPAARAGLDRTFTLKGIVLNIEERTFTLGIAHGKAVRVPKAMLPAKTELDLGNTVSIEAPWSGIASIQHVEMRKRERAPARFSPSERRKFPDFANP